MLIGRVVGNIVSTIKKDRDFGGRKLLLVQPVGLDLQPEPGVDPLICTDVVDAGIDDVVVYVDEGNSARQLLELDKTGAVRAVIVGIVDEVAIAGRKTWRKFQQDESI
ncbi:MAG: EutN/CcmL family microcompartment protein [Bradymonadales bacterium]|nr:EutN/CcmL family microcompartment protein [Bradymonadales bacterium]